MTARPSPGDLLIVDGRASVQFAGHRALTFRVVSVSAQPTYHGWIWLTGYVLNRRGEATARREVYIQLAGLRPANASACRLRERTLAARRVVEPAGDHNQPGGTGPPDHRSEPIVQLGAADTLQVPMPGQAEGGAKCWRRGEESGRQ